MGASLDRSVAVRKYVLLSLTWEFRPPPPPLSSKQASHRLHDRMLKRIIRAPILFFDSNPVGR